MKLKLRASVRFLASVFDGVGTAIRKDGLATYVDLDYSKLAPLSSFNPATKNVAVVDSVTSEWNSTTLSALLALSGYATTSSSTVAIALGAATFTVQAGLSYLPGARARASYSTDTSKYMEGLVTSYSGTALVISVSRVNGTGTFSAWNIGLAGDPGAGDVLSTNNGLDFSNIPATLNNLGGVSYANTQSLTSAQKLKARQNINVMSGGELNILDYGGVGDGSTNNDAALTAAWSALGAWGGCVYFPAGKYLFSSAFVRTYPSTRFQFAIRGDGPNNTFLYWSSAAGGITLTQLNARNAIQISDIGFTTGTTNGGTAINLVGVATSSLSVWSNIRNVEIRGDDGSAQTYYWTAACKAHVWSLINFTDAVSYGSSTGQGDGFIVEGDAASSTYGILYNFKTCSPNYHRFGLTYGDFVQGVTVTGGCNFNGNVGLAAIYNPSGCTGILAQLTVADSQFNYSGDQVSINSGLNQLKFVNNIITVSKNGQTGIYSIISTDFTINSNSFNLAGSPTSTTAIIVGPPGYGCIQGNNFQGYALGVNMLASTSNIYMNNNSFRSVTTKFVNSGTNPAPGTGAP